MTRFSTAIPREPDEARSLLIAIQRVGIAIQSESDEVMSSSIAFRASGSRPVAERRRP